MTTTTGGTGEPEDAKPDATETDPAPETTEVEATEAEETTEVEAEASAEEEPADDVPAAAEPDAPETAVAEPDAPEATVEEPSAEESADDVPAPAAVFADPVEVSESEDSDDEDDEDDESFEELAVGPTGPTGPGVLSVLGAVVAMVLVASVALLTYAWPVHDTKPHDVPFGIAGPAEITGSVKNLFANGSSHSFKVYTYSEESQLRAAIQDRKVYGGLALTQSSASMLVASGASPTVAQTLNAVAQQLGASNGIQIPVDDVVPLPDKDSRGAAFEATGLPLLLAGLLPGLLLAWRRFAGSTSAALAVAFVTSLAGGFALAAILQFWIDAYTGNYLLNALSVALGIAAVAFPLTGLAAIGGRIGLGIGGALMLLVGYPLSAQASAPEYLPSILGDLGQALPQGATATLLRSTVYFDGSGFSTPLVVLVAWTVGGLVLVGIGTLLNPNLDDLEDDEPFLPAEEPVPVG
ncbi:hypothetical protein ACIB24_02630 [Spongisporangium articulatum]|uniref:ABC transporter permease n=1 Tax=Spongisporangium articulatum TaxID=3362603 RepID=A0ABW8AHV4_9ACTN